MVGDGVDGMEGVEGLKVRVDEGRTRWEKLWVEGIGVGVGRVEWSGVEWRHAA